MAKTKYSDKRELPSQNLRDNECKITDGKGGFLYCSYYYDENGDRKRKTAKDLEKLRAKMAELENLRGSRVKLSTSGKTLDDCYYEWLHLKEGITGHTKDNYKWGYDHYCKGSKIGKMKLTDLTKGKIKAHYQGLKTDRGLATTTIDGLHTVVRQVLQYAVEERYIPNNPADGAITEIKRQTPKQQAHVALTKAEQDRFLQFLHDSEEYRHWEPVFVVLVNTGLRVSEVLGLRKCDIDWENDMISVNHGMLYYKDEDEGKMRNKVGKTKTKTSNRRVYMLPAVRAALLQEIENNEKAGIKCKEVIKGEKEAAEEYYSDFIFLNKEGNAQHAAMLNRAIKRITRDANLEAEEKDGIEFLPEFSCHNLRSTFITRAAENGLDISVTMNQVGHSDRRVTEEIYTSVDSSWIRREMDKLHSDDKRDK